MIYNCKSIKGTQEVASDLAKKIINLRLNSALVVALEGELGAGKTVFVKALAKALGVKDKIKSPTFVLMRKYKLIPSLKFRYLRYLYHLDCYRLRDEKDISALGIHEIFKESHNIVAIEWSDRVSKILPDNHIKVHIDHIAAKTRKIRI